MFSVACSPFVIRAWLWQPSQSVLQRQALGLVITGAPVARPAPLGAMSRVDALRRLSAQLSALAELEESIAQGISSVIGSAGTAGTAVSTAASAVTSAAPSSSSTPLRDAAMAALVRPAVSLTAPRGARSRSRSPAPLPKRAPRRSHSVASMRGSVALAESGLVTGLAVKSCPPVPPTQLRASRASRALQASSSSARAPGDAPAVASQAAQPAVAFIAPVAASDSDSEWGALLDAHGLNPPPASTRPPAPSRLSPLVQVGAPVTSGAGACAEPPSAPCGARSNSARPRVSVVAVLACKVFWFPSAAGSRSRSLAWSRPFSSSLSTPLRASVAEKMGWDLGPVTAELLFVRWLAPVAWTSWLSW